MTMKALCRIDELEENQAKGLALGADAGVQELFVIKRDSQIFVYKNSCPHTGVNLNWLPDQFMDSEQFFVQCAVHGAKFQVEDGLCVWGPCVNQRLTPVKFRVENGELFLNEALF